MNHSGAASRTNRAGGGGTRSLFPNRTYGVVSELAPKRNVTERRELLSREHL